MVLLDNPPVSPIGTEATPLPGDADPLRRRCALCLSWRPANEMVEMSSLITWCAACALRHPELVPPPSDVLWPISGFLVGVLAWWLLGLLQTAPHLVAGAVGLWCALGGLAAGARHLGHSGLVLSLLTRSATPCASLPTSVAMTFCTLLVWKTERLATGTSSRTPTTPDAVPSRNVRRTCAGASALLRWYLLPHAETHRRTAV